ncbi:hypothetical protein B0H13DRAFT_1886932 [Mycena leptocephala]|nr:hypothetical protein B0H13DRAFT_1886932 [Mycena leptocephala]
MRSKWLFKGHEKSAEKLNSQRNEIHISVGSYLAERLCGQNSRKNPSGPATLIETVSMDKVGHWCVFKWVFHNPLLPSSKLTSLFNTTSPNPSDPSLHIPRFRMSSNGSFPHPVIYPSHIISALYFWFHGACTSPFISVLTPKSTATRADGFSDTANLLQGRPASDAVDLNASVLVQCWPPGSIVDPKVASKAGNSRP